MRNMSFALTTDQMVAQTKDVTRRLGWLHLKPGEIIQPVKKCMGLRPGEKIEKICPPVRVLLTRRELLELLTTHPDYGWREVRREGFPDLEPGAFVDMFCDTHRSCKPTSVITRIEFSFDLLDGWEGMGTAPKDGSVIELLVRHTNWVYAASDERERWQGPCRAQWLDFNGGGWCWSGHMGYADRLEASLNTAFLLMAQYDGRAVIPVEEVVRDYFYHLTPEKFVRKAATGEIKLPLVRIETSQKAAKGVHLADLAEYLDKRRAAAIKEAQQIAGATAGATQ